jgi:hypothetical protein
MRKNQNEKSPEWKQTNRQTDKQTNNILTVRKRNVQKNFIISSDVGSIIDYVPDYTELYARYT